MGSRRYSFIRFIFVDRTRGKIYLVNYSELRLYARIKKTASVFKTDAVCNHADQSLYATRAHFICCLIYKLDLRTSSHSVIASALCEAISVTLRDCFVAENAPRNDADVFCVSPDKIIHQTDTSPRRRVLPLSLHSSFASTLEVSHSSSQATR